MRVLYCRTGWGEYYNGTDKLINGGSYNKEHIGHESYNFKSFAGEYYGYVEPLGKIDITRITNNKKSIYADDVLIIWIARPTTGGQYIVGWYKNARVYREKQYLPNNNLFKERIDKGLNDYYIKSTDAFLLNETQRIKRIKGLGHRNIWYGNENTNAEVLKFINEIETETEVEIKDELPKELIGKERKAIVKLRENQNYFRSQLLKKYHQKCALCPININELLFASHIKPWSLSNGEEKIDVNNGLLLCSNHNQLFDSGLITFDDKGNLLISSKIDEINKTFTNIRLNMKIEVNSEMCKFLKYHRKNIFKK